MHEIGMCEGVVAAVDERAGGRPVAAVGVRVGVALRVVPEAFRTAFELVAGGTAAEGARVELVEIPARARCRDCETAFDTNDALPPCPACGRAVVEVTGGDDLTLEWLEYAAGGPPADSDAAEPTPPQER